MSPRWHGRRSQPPSPNEDQQLDSYLQTKTVWESSRVHLRNFNEVEQKPESNCTKREGRMLHLLLIIPSAKLASLCAKRELIAVEFPSPGKGEQGD